MQPALLLTCSMSWDCSSVMLLIMISPYSSVGRMNDLYIISKLFRSRRYIRCARISTRLPALITISSTWLPQERFLVKIIPRCLFEATSFITVFPKYTGEIGSFLFLRETSKVSVLEGQKFTSHRSAHLLIVLYRLQTNEYLSWYLRLCHL